MRTCQNGIYRTQPTIRSAAWLLLCWAIGCGPAPDELHRSGDDPPRAASSGGTNGRGAFDGTGGSLPPEGSGGAGGLAVASGGTDGAGGAGGRRPPDSGTACSLVWSSGFENGFPGEWLNFDDGAYTANGIVPSGRVSAWTIVDDASGEPVYTGDHSYKGWIVGPSNQTHRAYPVLHVDLPTPLVNTFMVYLDTDYGRMSPSDWIHFATWGNADGQGNGDWALHTMSVRDGWLEFAHTTPHSGEYIGPSPAAEFPLGRWVRLTVYIHYQRTDGLVQVWQDGVPMVRARVSSLLNNPGTNVTRAHWGMYASAATDQGVQYNDDIRFWTLDTALDDLVSEPGCYLNR